jgi:predicted PurR-regulated permease PerM
MNIPESIDNEMERRLSRTMMDIFIRAGLVLLLTVLCYRVFSPFLPIILWSLILAVTMYPLHRLVAKAIGGRQGLASTLVIVAGFVVIVAPTTVLVSSLGDSLHSIISDVKNNVAFIPAPSQKVAEWPVVGKKIYGVWSEAHSNLPAMVASQQPKIGELTKQALDIVAGLGGTMLQFLVSFVIAGIIMAFGVPGTLAAQAIFERIVGVDRGQALLALSAATIRTVAAGVIGIACIQAIAIGLVLFFIKFPMAGLLSFIVLVLAIAQLPALLVTLPVVAYIWYGGDYGTITSISSTVVLLIAGLIDNVLKPLLLGRGVDAPMPVILLGALGGMASRGILGMFLGATLLALGYQIFMRWVARNPDRQPQVSGSREPLPGDK